MIIPNFILYQNNSSEIKLSLTDNVSLLPVTDGSGQFTVFQGGAGGTPVAGATNIPLIGGTLGVYAGTIDGSLFDPAVGTDYVTVIDFSSPTSGVGHWEILTTVEVRNS